MPSLSKYVSVTHSSDTPMSPAIGDVDLIGFYPSLSRDGAMVSDKHSGTTALLFKHVLQCSKIVVFFVYTQEMVLGQPRGTYVIYKEETR